MRMWATRSPVGSSASLDWLKPSEQKYPHSCVFSAAWGNAIMPRLIRLTLTIPLGKSLHICNGQIIMLPQMFVSSLFVCACVFVLALVSLEDHQCFFFDCFFFVGLDVHHFSVFLGLRSKHGWMPSSLSQGQALHGVSSLTWISVLWEMPRMVIKWHWTSLFYTVKSLLSVYTKFTVLNCVFTVLDTIYSENTVFWLKICKFIVHLW